MVDVNARRTMCTLVAAACIDGKFDNTEKSVVYRKGREFGMTPQMIDEIVELGKKGALAVSIPPTQKLKEDLLNDLIEIVCADGRLEPPENHMLMKFAGHLGLSVHDLGERVRKRMSGARRPQPQSVEPVLVIEEPPKSKARQEHSSYKPPPPRPAPPPPPPPPRYEVPPSISPPPVMQIAAPPGRIGGMEPSAPIDAPKEMTPPRPPGPVQLDGPSLIGSGPSELGEIALGLVRQSISVEGIEGAIHYLGQFWGITDATRARQIVDQILRANPDLKPGTNRAQFA